MSLRTLLPRLQALNRSFSSTRNHLANPWSKHTTVKMSAAASTDSPNAFTQPINKTAHEFDKGALDATLSRRFFYAPAFEIYGGGSACVIPIRGPHLTHHRCRWSVRLRTTRFRPAGQHSGCVEKALHHRGGHAGAGHHDYDPVRGPEDVWPRGQVRLLRKGG